MSESPTIRERVADIETRMATSEQTPDSTRMALVSLTGLLGKAASHLRVCELAYKKVLRDEMAVCQKANRAKVNAEASVYYASYREALDVHKSIKEMIVTCRAYLRSIDEEMRLAR